MKSILIISKRLAGHSKWANIRHIKADKDGQRSRLFLQLAQRIRVAIHDGKSANPLNNLRLSQAIEVAKKRNMPIATIQNVIKSAQSSKSKLQEYIIEVRGPRGSIILLSTISDNLKRTKDSIAHILKKHNATFADVSAQRQFNYKGLIIAEPPDDSFNIDSITEHAIECGAEDVTLSETQDNSYQFICEANSLDNVRRKLEELQYKITEADDYYIPESRIPLPEVDLELLSKLFDKLDNHPDVVRLFDNIA